MTRFDPNLCIRRVIIKHNEKAVYDEQFHTGVNIIRGDNSSGKSTILNFIHYGLGGDVSDWSDMALLCERVTIEALMSGRLVTLSRTVSVESQQAMDVYFGSYNESQKADISEWGRYPYRRSQSKESFSQVLFRTLGIPEAASEDSGNITMHQMMRLLYADQLSPVDEIFAHQGFDNVKIREAVGRLLCGAFDNELYANELEIRLVSKDFESVSLELNSLYRALGGAGHDLNLAWVKEQQTRNDDERTSVNDSIAALHHDRRPSDLTLTLSAQKDAYEKLVASQAALAVAREKRDALKLEIEDSAAFIRSLEEKLTALKDSALVAEELGSARFSTCPACYEELAQGEVGVCALCKEPFDDELAVERIGGLINDTTLQLRQSKYLQEDRVERLLLAEASLPTADSNWQVAAKKYAEVQRRPTSEEEYRISELYKRIGYLDRRDEDLSEKAKLIEIIEALAAQKFELNGRLSTLKARNEQLLYAQQARLSDAYLTISDSVRVLLSKDLKRQDSFENPQKVDFSFADNRIGVDGHTYFSASSRAVLKSAFILGFHVAATLKGYFRHPRFVMLDTIEDKGMEPARSKNFQHLIVQVSAGSETENQVIFGTAMISEDLDNSDYVVGRFYTRDEPSLKFS